MAKAKSSRYSPIRRLGLTGPRARIEVATSAEDRLPEDDSPDFTLSLPAHPQLSDTDMAALRRQGLEQELRALKDEEKLAKKIMRLQDGFSKKVAQTVGLQAWSALRAEIMRDRARLHRLRLSDTATGTTDEDEDEKRRAAAADRYEAALRRAGLDSADLRQATTGYRKALGAAFAGAAAPDPSIQMISREWGLPTGEPQDTRQIWDSFFYHRTRTQKGGDRDLLQPFVEANRETGRLRVDHVWENHDSGNADAFWFWGTSQLGEVLWLNAGESFSLEVTIRCVHTVYEVFGKDEWGWSDAYYSGRTILLIEVGPHQHRADIWAHSGGTVGHRLITPVAQGEVRTFRIDNIGPIAAGGFYIVWSGLRQIQWSEQNDFSLNILHRDRWKLVSVKVIQRANQRP
ncbi:MAG: hypothetical protein GY791_06785 [Alphaproteobacteria bacterium]|nr:hypothetical protein [Alphaproteobacteria bacterium]